MEIETRSDAYEVRRLDERDVDAILAVCKGNGLFYQYHPPMATQESILADMTALPPNKRMEDKAYVGFFEEGKLTAVLDWISGLRRKNGVDRAVHGQRGKTGARRRKRNHPQPDGKPEGGGVSGNSARRGQRKSAELRVLEEKRV